MKLSIITVFPSFWYIDQISLSTGIFRLLIRIFGVYIQFLNYKGSAKMTIMYDKGVNAIMNYALKNLHLIWFIDNLKIKHTNVKLLYKNMHRKIFFNVIFKISPSV